MMKLRFNKGVLKRLLNTIQIRVDLKEVGGWVDVPTEGVEVVRPESKETEVLIYNVFSDISKEHPLYIRSCRTLESAIFAAEEHSKYCFTNITDYRIEREL